MTTPEIVQLIETCAKNSVTKAKFGDIELTFSGFREPAPQLPPELQRALESQTNAEEWLTQHIPPAPLPLDDEVE